MRVAHQQKRDADAQLGHRKAPERLVTPHRRGGELEGAVAFGARLNHVALHEALEAPATLHVLVVFVDPLEVVRLLRRVHHCEALRNRILKSDCLDFDDASRGIETRSGRLAVRPAQLRISTAGRQIIQAASSKCTCGSTERATTVNCRPSSAALRLTRLCFRLLQIGYSTDKSGLKERIGHPNLKMETSTVQYLL